MHFLALNVAALVAYGSSLPVHADPVMKAESGHSLASDTTTVTMTDTAQVAVTTDILAKLKTFYVQYMQDAAPVRESGLNHRLLMPLPEFRVAGLARPLVSQPLLFPDMVARAEQVPEIANNLRTAGMTAKEFLQWRRSIICAATQNRLEATVHGDSAAIDTSTVIGRNAAFIRKHPTEWMDLAKSGMQVPVSLAMPIVAQHWFNTPDSAQTLQFGDGHPYLMVFTAHWCIACPQSYPTIFSLTNQYAARGLRTIFVTALFGNFAGVDGVVPQVELDSVRNYFKRHNVTMPVAVLGDVRAPAGTDQGNDARNANFVNYGIGTLPAFVLVQGDGQPRRIWQGWDAKYPDEFATELKAMLP